MNFLDLFAGIGGFRLGMERAGHKCVGFCEIDKFARSSYKAMHNTENEIEYHDINEVTNEEFRKLRGKVDVICGGFPCQAFSIAGNQLGFEDARGTLFYEIARAAKEIKPRYLLLENVRNLLSHDKGQTFTRILKILDELGYDVEWQVLNSKNFGVPQNRERVFIVGHLRGECAYKVFPIRGEDKELDFEPKISIIGNTKNPNGTRQGTRTFVHDKNGIVGALTATDYKEPKQVAIDHPNYIKIKGYISESKYRSTSQIYDVQGISPTLNTMQGGGREPKIMIKEANKQGYSVATVGDSINLSRPNSKTRRGRVGKNIANTLLTTDEQGVVLSDYKIRKLTPKECWRLQGFPDELFDKAQEVNSNSQLYKQAGNSVTVNVIEEIAKKLK
nr:MAG TPA: Cytosine specific methyltransferase [Caudoviricetes sp.]